ncbi:MAG: condensation domain-containing protein, partial [Myxococcota bacterium]
GYLAWVVHHLGVDDMSWTILADDLRVACAQLARGSAASLPSEGTTVAAWHHGLRNYACSEQGAEEATWWRSMLEPFADDVGDVSGLSPRATTQKRAGTRVAMTPAQTREWFETLTGRHRIQVRDAVFTAIGGALCRASGRDAVVVHVEGHGREPTIVQADLHRTVGWFTSLYPLVLRASKPGESPIEAMRRTGRTLDAVPHGGVGYGALRYGSPDVAVRRALTAPAVDVCINYLGGRLARKRADAAPTKAPSDRTSAPSPLMRGLAIAVDEQPGYALQISIGIVGEAFVVEMLHDPSPEHTHSARRLADDILSAVRALAGGDL